MKKSLCFLFAPALLLLAQHVSAQCQPNRYYDKIFSVDAHHSIVYGHNTDYAGHEQTLYMDIFEPSGDNLAHRPLIILAFGGSFTSGVRQSPDLLVLTDEFAKRGYVTATIDYRIGVENSDDTSMYKAVIRGMQDMNAAIRFFYKDVYTTNTYRIDTSQIFVGGTSAGGFIGLNSVYYKPMFSRPVDNTLLNTLVEMGGLVDGSGNEGYSNKVKGVIDLCGAILDTIWIQPGDPILVGVHGTADSTVPYYYDSIRGINDIKSRFYGGGDIINRCNDIGFNYGFKTFYGADHAPFVLPSTPYLPPSKQYMDTTIWTIRDFLYQNVVCDPTTVSGIQEKNLPLPVSVLPNESDNLIQVFSHYEKTIQLGLYSLEGKLILHQQISPHSEVSIYKHNVGAGIYLLRLSDAEHVNYNRTEKIVFY